MAQERGPVARLVDFFADLPGIGRKSAERLAYHVLGMPRAEALALADAIRAVKENLRPCRTCSNLCEGDECGICRDPRRDRGLLCVVEQVRDLIAIEEAGGYRGLYHVLRGRVAPLEGTGPEKLTIDQLVARVEQGGFREVIMARRRTSRETARRSSSRSGWRACRSRSRSSPAGSRSARRCSRRIATCSPTPSPPDRSSSRPRPAGSKVRAASRGGKEYSGRTDKAGFGGRQEQRSCGCRSARKCGWRRSRCLRPA